MSEFESDTKPFNTEDSMMASPNRPLTSRDIDMEDAPPYMTKLKSRPPSATSRMLPVDEPERPIQTPVQDFVAPMDARPKSTKSMRSMTKTPVPAVPVLPPPPYSPGKKGSPDSMSMLLPPHDPNDPEDTGIDFTKLSIEDIIQIKMIMGQGRRPKPKKIITA